MALAHKAGARPDGGSSFSLKHFRERVFGPESPVWDLTPFLDCTPPLPVLSPTANETCKFFAACTSTGTSLNSDSWRRRRRVGPICLIAPRRQVFFSKNDIQHQVSSKRVLDKANPRE